jgi:Flp pilus assembly protein TadG
MLMPAGALVVLLLGAIAFDLSLVFLRQRQASSLAADVANDLASVALDVPTFRESGAFVLDPARADAVGRSLLDASDLADEVTSATITVSAADTVTVRVTVSVDYVFAKAIPGAADGTTVTASATAVASPG